MVQWIIDAFFKILEVLSEVGLGLLAELVELLDSSYGVDLSPFLAYVEIANMWVPVSEFLAAMQVYYILVVAVRMIRWALKALPFWS